MKIINHKHKNYANNEQTTIIILLFWCQSDMNRQSLKPELSLIQILSNIWEELKVPEQYRKIVMKYLKALPSKQQQRYLMFEIQWNRSHQSHYQLIFRLNMRRKIIFFKIKSLLRQLKSFQNAKVGQLCLLLCTLRDINVELSEKIIEMIRFYNLVLEEMQQRKILIFLWQLIDNLQEDNRFIFTSQYRSLFKLDGYFDPYFISYYENQSKMPRQPVAKGVEKLYSLSIKEIYKIISLKHKIQLIMTTIRYRLQSEGYRVDHNAVEESLYFQQGKNSPFRLYSQSNEVGQKISNTGRKYDLPSRSYSHDPAIRFGQHQIPQLFNSNDKNGKSSMHLGKIVKNTSIIKSNPNRQSNKIQHKEMHSKNNMLYQKKDQIFTDSKCEKLNLVQLQPINIKIDKSHKRASPQNTSLPLKQAYEQRYAKNIDPSQFLQYSHIKITKINNLSRKNLQSRKNLSNSKIRYDVKNKNRKAHRIPGLIKNSKANILSHQDKEMGLYEEKPITNKAIKSTKKEAAVQQQSREESLDMKSKEQPSQQTSYIQTVSREIQTQRVKITTKHHQKNIKVDADCQTKFDNTKFKDHNFDDLEDSPMSQKQECNNKSQHQEAISYFKSRENKKLSDSLVTLEEQYFVDERSTPAKRYKIPMIRTITEEELEIIEHQKKSLANYISSKKKLH